MASREPPACVGLRVSVEKGGSLVYEDYLDQLENPDRLVRPARSERRDPEDRRVVLETRGPKASRVHQDLQASQVQMDQ